MPTAADQPSSLKTSSSPTLGLAGFDYAGGTRGWYLWRASLDCEGKLDGARLGIGHAGFRGAGHESLLFTEIVRGPKL